MATLTPIGQLCAGSGVGRTNFVYLIADILRLHWIERIFELYNMGVITKLTIRIGFAKRQHGLERLL